MKKYNRKITKIGNSYGVTIPVELLKETGMSYGDDVRIGQKDGKLVVSKRKELPEGIDDEFMDVLNDVIKEHQVAFKGLVEK